jgi:hypothetical protein
LAFPLMEEPQGHEAADESQQRRPKPLGYLPERLSAWVIFSIARGR